MNEIPEESRAARFDGEYPFFARMRARLREDARRLLDARSAIFDDEAGGRLVGVEIECSGLTAEGPMTEALRDELVDAESGREWGWAKEFGAAQIEIRTAPVDVRSTRGLAPLKEALVAESERLAARLRSRGVHPLRLGADPVVRLDESVRTQSVPRYRIVPDFHQAHRRPGMRRTLGLGGGQVRADRALVIGALSGIQFNVDCKSSTEAVGLLNQAFATAAYALALGANARYLDGVDTGFADLRSALWETSHDIRTHGELADGMASRVGPPSRYFSSLADYFADLHDQPSIFDEEERALERAVGLYWRDARIKFFPRGGGRYRLALEFRPLSVQPSAFEDYALLAFALGHLFGARAKGGELLPLSCVHDNRWSAMLQGMGGTLWSTSEGAPKSAPARDVLRRETDTAAAGLSLLGAGGDEVREVREVWAERLADGSPAERMAHELAAFRGGRRGSRIGRRVIQDFLYERIEAGG